MGIIYGLDPAGNIVQMVDQLSLNRSQSFGYDLVDRLISAEGMYGEEAYTYDLVGNRLGKTETNGSTTTDTYSYSLTSNRLTDISGNNPQAITYDATGNIISRGSDTFTYNARNRLAEVTRNGTTLATYQHNGKGERVSKTVHDGTTTTTYFVYDLAGNIIAEADGTGAITREYAYHNERLAMFTYGLANEIYYYHNDHLGTPKAVTDSTGAVAWQGDYTPFGEVTETVALIEQPFRFPGQYFDAETGLYYNYFRDYDPSIGRYIQSDPIGLAGGINTYGYVNGNPVNFTDRFGLFCNSSNGMTSCSYPGGPSFSVPTPIGYPSTLEGPGIAYHGYDVRRPLNGTDSKCVMQQLNDNPTPGRPSPATPEGTANNATVLGMDNHVTSYSVNDSVTGAPLVVNIAGVGDGSLFGPGYVARGISNGQAYTVGEGLNWKQAPLLTGYGFNYVANEALWGGQMNDIINNCTCQN